MTHTATTTPMKMTPIVTATAATVPVASGSVSPNTVGDWDGVEEGINDVTTDEDAKQRSSADYNRIFPNAFIQN